MLRVFDATGSAVQIATWNVNSVRTRLDQVLSWLESEQPDLLCLQETKVTPPTALQTHWAWLRPVHHVSSLFDCCDKAVI